MDKVLNKSEEWCEHKHDGSPPRTQENVHQMRARLALENTQKVAFSGDFISRKNGGVNYL